MGSIAGATTGAVGKITNSLGGAIEKLSFDEKYIKAQEIRDIKEKPTDTLDGIGKGFKSFGRGLA